MDKVSAAYALMAERRTNCAQAILSTYCEGFGLERNLALRLAQGFGAGMGQKANICGAVTGAYMVLGLSQKMFPDNPRESLDATYELVREFDRRFKVLHGSVICRELIGYDLSTPEGLAEAREKKVFTSVCPGLVGDSAKILESMLGLK
jgi:C_GCAxxG_C_C family probable redox protein